MKDAMKLILINIVSTLAAAGITAISSSIYIYVVPKIKKRFERWKWRQENISETEKVEFRDYKNIGEAAELMSAAFREDISIKYEDSFILCTRADLRKSLQWEKISSEFKRTANKNVTATVRFNVYKRINNI